ncbi:hypothetical protein JZ751_000028, partial [Albula glossodonta]
MRPEPTDKMADELPIAPGQLYIEVEYDYDYKAKDKLISIRQGECYVLVKKTNEDWWQVRKDENTKAFYVPAQYVREVRKALMPPPKPLHLGGPPPMAKPTFLDIRRSDENLSKHPEMSSFGKPLPSPGPITPPGFPRDANQNLGSPGYGVVDHLHDNNNAFPGLPLTRAVSPCPRSPLMPRRHLPTDSGEVDRTPPRRDSAEEGEEKLRNDSESGDELSSSSTEQLQATGSQTVVLDPVVGHGTGGVLA